MTDLRPPLHEYSIDLLPAPPEREVLQGLIDRLAAQHGVDRFTTHLTLLPLGNIDEEEAGRALDAAKESARGIRPFTLELLGIGMSQRYFQSLFVTVALTAELSTLPLRTAMATRRVGAAPFLPHFSLAIFCARLSRRWRRNYSGSCQNS